MYFNFILLCGTHFSQYNVVNFLETVGIKTVTNFSFLANKKVSDKNIQFIEVSFNYLKIFM